MANNDWEDFDDDDQGDGSDLVKKLRAQLKAANKRAAELEATAGELSKKYKQREVKDILSSLGVTPKVARFVLADVEDPTEETVKNWAVENAEIFGFTIGDGDQQDQKVPQGMSAEEAANLAAINGFVDGSRPATTGSDEDLEQQIVSTTSEEELLKLIGGGPRLRAF